METFKCLPPDASSAERELPSTRNVTPILPLAELAEGGFTCHFEELPENFSEGETVDEARTNLWDALEQVMTYHREEARKSAIPGAVREELQLAAS